MKTRDALRVVAIVLAGLATVGEPNVLADKVKVEEFYGTGFRATSLTRTDEALSDCADTDPSTNVVLRTNTGTVTYTGIMEGIGETLAKVLEDSCVPGQTHTTFRTLDTFDTITVAGRTGGAVVEVVGHGRIVPTGPTTTATLNEIRIRILCGTGDLKGIHAEGTITTSVRPGAQSRAMQVWAHFGHNHDFGFDFLCKDRDSAK